MNSFLIPQMALFLQPNKIKWVLVLAIAVAGQNTLYAQLHKPFTFIAIGDAGKPGDVLRDNASAMYRYAQQAGATGDSLSLLLFLGDNFYPNGLNHSPAVARALVDSVLGPHLPLFSIIGRARTHAVAGNHDYYCTAIMEAPFGTCTVGNKYESAIPWWTYHYGMPSSLRYPVSDGSADSVEVIIFDSAVLLNSDPVQWPQYLDSLQRLLVKSKGAAGVRWRIFAAHHSPYSFGEHGGYRRWLPSLGRVGYIGNCVEDGQDPLKYAERFLYHEDNCDPVYQAYVDSLFAVMGRSGAQVHLFLAGHDHSLQLLNYDGRMPANCPNVFVVSGAGAKRGQVRSPSPPYIYSHPILTNEEKGKSIHGFVTGKVEGENLVVQCISGGAGKPIDMGEGATEFVIDSLGRLGATR